ncbi:VCBS repeat-containing protein [Candidatus Dependentiae bacterium]|nr:VCBS repeat-containing protein [Candidatus Dependentiae bacterium]
MKRFIVILGLLFVCTLFIFGEANFERVLKGTLEGEGLPGCYLGGAQNARVSFADLDNDGDLDFILGLNSHYLWYFRNDGNANTFTWVIAEPYFINTGSINNSPAFVDIDNDNDDDLFIGYRNGNIKYYRNDGTPESYSFTFVTNDYLPLPISSEVSHPIFPDIDGDNDFDCLITNLSITSPLGFSLFRNIGTSDTPSWSAEENSYGGIFVSSADSFFCDINGDGTLDWLSGNNSGNIEYYRNDGTPNTPTWTFITNNYASIDVGYFASPEFHDFDGDEDLDLFLGNSEGDLFYYRNDGDTITASFTDVGFKPLYFDAGMRSHPGFVDIDNDNKQDIFIGLIDGTITYLSNEGSSETPAWTVVSENYESIDIGDHAKPVFIDIDNDNDYDMFIGEINGRITFYRNDGNAGAPIWVFVTATYNSIDIGSSSAPEFTDIDNDGDYDLFIGEATGNLNFYRNDGTPEVPSWTYVTATYNSFTEMYNGKPSFGDIDNDGDPDLFVSVGSKVRFYRNTGTPETAAWTLISDDYLSTDGMDLQISFKLVDINNDGFLDLLSGAEGGGLLYWKHSGFTVVPSLNWCDKTEFNSDGVNPDSDNYPNSFEFRVEYINSENEKPGTEYPKVHILKGGAEITGSPFTMTDINSGDTTYTDGKEYRYIYDNLELGIDYTYYFECYDEWGALATGEPTNPKDGPDVLGNLSGTITENGQPLTGVTVTLSGDASGEYVTGNDGQYSFTGLEAGATYVITPGKNNYDFTPGSYTITNFSDNEVVDFTGVGLFADNLTNSKVYPNPYKPGLGVDYIVFDNLTENAKIRIYTIQGELIFTAIPDAIEYKWNIINDSGNKIASGIYLYVITDNKGREKQGKLAIVK